MLDISISSYGDGRPDGTDISSKLGALTASGGGAVKNNRKISIKCYIDVSRETVLFQYIIFTRFRRNFFNIVRLNVHQNIALQ